MSRAEEIEKMWNEADCWLDGSTEGQIAGGKALELIFAYAKELEARLSGRDGAWVKG